MIHHELLDIDPDDFLKISLATLEQRKQRLIAVIKVPKGYVVLSEDLVEHTVDETPIKVLMGAPDIGSDVKGGGAV